MAAVQPDHAIQTSILPAPPQREVGEIELDVAGQLAPLLLEFCQELPAHGDRIDRQA